MQTCSSQFSQLLRQWGPCRHVPFSSVSFYDVGPGRHTPLSSVNIWRQWRPCKYACLSSVSFWEDGTMQTCSSQFRQLLQCGSRQTYSSHFSHHLETVKAMQTCSSRFSQLLRGWGHADTLLSVQSASERMGPCRRAPLSSVTIWRQWRPCKCTRLSSVSFWEDGAMQTCSSTSSKLLVTICAM